MIKKNASSFLAIIEIGLKTHFMFHLFLKSVFFSLISIGLKRLAEEDLERDCIG